MESQQFTGYIKNVTKNKWYGGTSKAGRPIHSQKKELAVIFWDEGEAESELEMLNETQKDCYTLIQPTEE